MPERPRDPVLLVVLAIRAAALELLAIFVLYRWTSRCNRRGRRPSDLGVVRDHLRQLLIKAGRRECVKICA